MTSSSVVEGEPPHGRAVIGSHGAPVPHFVERLPVGVAACSIAGVWLNPSNGISVNITATATQNVYAASCIGKVGWYGATINVSGPTAQHPQGTATLFVPSTGERDTGVFSTYATAGAPVCSNVVWSSGAGGSNTWILEPWASKGVVPGIPKTQGFSEGNGNEHRLSFKGFGRDFALLIESPNMFTNNAMIINTNKHLTGDTSPGPLNHKLLPKNSVAPSDADYRCDCPPVYLLCP